MAAACVCLRQETKRPRVKQPLTIIENGMARSNGLKRTAIGRTLACLVGLWLMALAGASSAQTAVLTSANSKIDAASTPYRLTWKNGQGEFIREAFGPQPEARWSLVFLHADAGPKGYSRYLNWFLARGKNDYALLWCYMNQTGKEFWCWLYQYPSNQLTTVRFTGDYEFVPPSEPIPPISVDALNFTVGTRYVGPDFKFLDWTRKEANLKSIDLKAVHSPDTLPKENAPVLKTLTNLSGSPLHELRVPAANGWRADGWRELHAMVYDPAKDPYYVIAYSNSSVGYVVDLKRAQTYTADFGATITFGGDETSFVRPVEPPQDLLETRVQKFEPFEATMVSSAKHENPYTDVLLEADIKTPDGKRIKIPGYWDGNGTWRIRFTPTRVGTWSWRTRSNDPELHSQEGEIECVAETQSRGGFFLVDASSAYRRHFIQSERARTLPTVIADAVHYNKWERNKVLPAISLVTLETTLQSEATEALEYSAFQKRMDNLALAGFNRTYGGYIIDPDDFEKGVQSNEGGKPFLDNNLDQLNPAYFRAMDKRISYCNEKGIVPDIGIGAFRALSAKYDEAQLRAIWRYLLARYSAYNVTWNLFAATKTPYTAEEESKIELFGGMTVLYGPVGHPVTSPVAYQGNMLVEPTKTELDKSQSASENKRSAVVALPFEVPFAGGRWQSVITLSTSNPAAIWEAWRYDKPVMVLDNGDSPIDSEATRRRIWEIFLRGGMAISGAKTTAESQLIEPEIVANAAKFFNQTRFWRLEPHPELLGGPLEDEAMRRRRKRIQLENAQNKKGTVSVPPAKADGPIYLLADRAREYVVYFSKGGSVLLDLMEATGKIQMRWFDPRTGKFTTEETLMGGEYHTFTAPDTNDWVLHLTRR